MFLKDDKYVEDPAYGGLKEPRCIQYRNYRYGIRLGRYLKPLEHSFYQFEVDGLPISAKGLNSYGRARVLWTMWNDFSNPVACLFDHSKFDAHVSVELLQMEHRFYNQFYGSDELAWLLSLQVSNRGRTKNGTRYRVNGTRMSGDQNTGFGNTLINYAILASLARRAGVRVRIFVDGDDSVVICSRDDVPRLAAQHGWFAMCGMETNAVEITEEFCHVEFCQCRPVRVGGVWRMVRNPLRVVTRMPWTTRKYNASGYSRLTRTVGWSERICNSGVPVLQEYSAWFMAQGAGRLIQGMMSERVLLEDTQVLTGVITPECRRDFEEAWGVPVATQIAMEERIRAGLGVNINLLSI
jgi:hypothetical protein